MPGYLEEKDCPAKDSQTETFVAIKAFIDNWRWAGVPFYLRTGKRMPEKLTEIVITYKSLPHNIFAAAGREDVPNRLVIRLQPNEGVGLQLMTKDPGPGGMRLRAAPLDLSFAEEFNVRYPDSYERLLLDVVRGDSTLFSHGQQRGSRATPFAAGQGPARAFRAHFRARHRRGRARRRAERTHVLAGAQAYGGCYRDGG